MSLSADQVDQIVQSISTKEVLEWVLNSNSQSLRKEVIDIYNNMERGDKELALTRLIYMGVAINGLKDFIESEF